MAPRRSNAPKFYAVAKGRTTGIFRSWRECEPSIAGFSNCCFKSFPTRPEAEDFLRLHNCPVPPPPPPEPAPPKGKRGRPRGSHYAANQAQKAATAAAKRAKEQAAEQAAAKRPKLSPEEEKAEEEAAAAAEAADNFTISRRFLSVAIQFDGGSRGNPGNVAGSGAVVTINNFEGTRRVLHIRSYLNAEKDPNRYFTNNQAEYDGVLAALRVAHQEVAALATAKDNLHAKFHIQLVLQGDSDLIIQQLKGNYQCRSSLLQGQYQLARRLLKDFETLGECRVSLEHVFREDNKQADGR